MRERPILFSGPMVRAILEGKKTQTRRVVKPQPSLSESGCWYPAPPRQPTHRARHYANEAHLRRGLATDFCPHGQPGDRLWVRETWAKAGEVGDCVEYRADNEDPTAAKWRPSIHMPRWASRIDLEVTDVRVKRLHEIGEGDAAAEGVDLIKAKVPTAREAFRYLWDDINGFGAWATNPWVWVVKFRRVSP